MTTPNAITHLDLDRLLVDTLKDVHNQGAELYNGGDHLAAFRLYQGGLVMAKPLLGHRAKAQGLIADALDEVERSNLSIKVKAFRLHEAIEAARTELKAALQQSPPAPPKPIPQSGTLTGTVTLNDKPAPAGLTINLMLHSATTVVASGKTTATGGYEIAGIPVAGYRLVVVGDGVPEKFTKPDTTVIKVDVKAGSNTLPLELK